MENESDLETTGAEVGEALPKSHAGELLGGFHFDDDLLVDEQIDALTSDVMALVVQVDADFTLDEMAPIARLDLQRVCVGALEKAVPESIVDLVEGTDDGLGELI